MNIERDAVLSMWSMKISLCFQFFFASKNLFMTHFSYDAPTPYTLTRERVLCTEHMIQRQRQILCQVAGAQTWCEDDCVNFSLIFLDENTEKKHAKDGEGGRERKLRTSKVYRSPHNATLRIYFFTILQSCSAAGLHDAFETFDSLFFPPLSSHSFQSFSEGGKSFFFLFPHYSSYSSLVTEQ